MFYTTEKTVKEMEGKLDPADKENIEKAVADVRKTLEGDDTEMIKKATEHLTEVSYAAFGKVISGMEVVDAICEHTPVTDRNGTVTKANQPVIERIIRVEKPEE